MAIDATMLQLMMKHSPRQGRALSAGYPDVLVTKEGLRELLKDDFARLSWRGDPEEVVKWHGLTEAVEICSSESLFKVLGFEDFDVIDIHAWRGGEIIANLNEPLPVEMRGRYSLVLDPGTSEHCFHIGQSAINLASCVSVGGVILQSLPLQSYNHGFYNICPTWFHSFYPRNGFKILWCHTVDKEFKFYDSPAHKRFRQAPVESFTVCVARRETDQEILPVMQEKYRMKLS